MAADERLKARPAPEGPAAYLCSGRECVGPFGPAADLIQQTHDFLNRDAASPAAPAPASK